MKKFLAGVGVLSVPFSAVANSSVVFASNKAEIKQQNAINKDQGDKLGSLVMAKDNKKKEIEETQNSSSFFGLEDIKSENFKIKKATQNDVEFMANSMPVIQNERWLKNAALIEGVKTEEQWKKLFTGRIKDKRIEEFLIKNKDGKVIGGFEIQKYDKYNEYVCYFVSMSRYKEELKKSAREILSHISSSAPKGAMIEMVANINEKENENEYKNFCKSIVKSVENRYSRRFEKSSFNIKEKKGIEFICLIV